MSSGVTRINYEGCQECLNDINKQIDALSYAAQQIDKVMYSLSVYWEGASHDRALEEYEASYKEQLTVKVPNAVESLRTYMNKCHETIKEADAAMSGL